jgi:hypothetical protein
VLVGDVAVARLVRRVDDIDRIEVGHDLEVAQGHDALVVDGGHGAAGEGGAGPAAGDRQPHQGRERPQREHQLRADRQRADRKPPWRETVKLE